jgi:hypothetical protein
MTGPDAPQVNCWSCRHFEISWDPNYRYQCKKLGFKSSNLPCIEVRSTDGRDCLGFESKIQNKDR